jgi:hypothetical protein
MKHWIGKSFGPGCSNHKEWREKGSVLAIELPEKSKLDT